MSNKLRCDEGTYDWVRATVSLDQGYVQLTYKATELLIEGRDSFSDDNLSEWTDDDIQNTAGSMLGIIETDRKYIEVSYE